jgi:hypothetical protein
MLPSTVATPYHVCIDRQATVEYGSLEIDKLMAGRPRTVQTPDLEEAVRDTIEEKPSSITCTTAHDLQIQHMTVWQVLKEHHLYPFHHHHHQSHYSPESGLGLPYGFRDDITMWVISPTINLF